MKLVNNLKNLIFGRGRGQGAFKSKGRWERDTIFFASQELNQSSSSISGTEGSGNVGRLHETRGNSAKLKFRQDGLKQAGDLGRLLATMTTLNRATGAQISKSDLWQTFKALERSKDPTAVSLALKSLQELQNSSAPAGSSQLRDTLAAINKRFNRTE